MWLLNLFIVDASQCDQQVDARIDVGKGIIDQCFFILENANITITQQRLREEIQVKEDNTQRKNR